MASLLVVMEAEHTPVFWVNAKVDPVVIEIRGRVSYLNCSSLKPFFDRCTDQGRQRFVVDFKNCSGADSTFWGLLVGIALRLKKETQAGTLTLQHLEGANLESVVHLGLHHLLCVARPDELVACASGAKALEAEMASAKLILEAHKDLVAAEPENAHAFQDVIRLISEQEVDAPRS